MVAGQAVPVRALTEQPGQLGDVGFLDPSGLVRAVGVRAGIIGAALADLPAAVAAICHACSGTSRSAAFSRSPSAQPTEQIS